MEQQTSQAIKHLQTILEISGLNAQVSLEQDDTRDVTLAIHGQDAHWLVGSHGRTLDALQHLLLSMIGKGQEQRVRVTVDADGYRANRVKTLTAFAHKLADEVTASGQEAITDPLNAFERRIIHTALLERQDVKTYSEGDDPGRYVVVSPADSAENEVN